MQMRWWQPAGLPPVRPISVPVGSAPITFKIASDFDTVLVLNGSVSLRRSAECKGRSVTFCVPTIFRTAIGFVGRCDGQAVFSSPPFEDIFVVIHPKWIRLSIDLASVGTVDSNRRKYADLSAIVSFVMF
jgi:hypothetical protein